MENEESIIKRFAEGDEESFKAIFNFYYNDLCRFVYVRFLRDKSDSEEIVQKIFIKLWEKRSQSFEIGSLKSYLYKSTSNACINYFEHQAVINKYKNEASFKLKQIELSFDCEESDENRLNLVIEKLNQLPDQTRRIFNLKYNEGLRIKQIANKLNISEKTVQTLLYRGLKHLREMLIFLFILTGFKFLIDLIIHSK